MQALVWLHRVWLRVIWFGTSHANLRWPPLFKHHIWGKPPYCIRENMVILHNTAVATTWLTCQGCGSCKLIVKIIFSLHAYKAHCEWCFERFLKKKTCNYLKLTLILWRSCTGTVWFYTSTSNKRAARPKLYTKSLTRDLKRMYRRFTLVRISINL